MLRRISKITVILTVCLLSGSPMTWAVEQHRGILEGTVLNLDNAAKTVVVKVADGTQHTFHFVKRTAVHGVQGSAAGAQDAFRGLKEGSEVAVHYSAKGTDETAEEIDNVGRDGLKATEGTATHIDRGAKTLSLRTADGTDEVYRLTDSAAKDAGKDVTSGAEQSAKVTVYYTEEGGHKVVHFFKKTL
jgi:hypothetical protein